MASYDHDFWRPLRPAAAALLLADFPAPWWIAGGWALDLFLGRETREHADLDLGLFSADQLAVQTYLVARGWELHCPDPPGVLRPWLAGETLPEHAHCPWARRDAASPWEFQLLLNLGGGDTFISRRDPALSRPLSQALIERDGLRLLAPEIQLHFKAKSGRPRDEADFRNVLPALDAAAKEWLLMALQHTYPGHAWIKAVAAATSAR